MKRLLLFICLLIIIFSCGCEDTPSSVSIPNYQYEGKFDYHFTKQEIGAGAHYSLWEPGDSIEVSIEQGKIYFGGKHADWTRSEEYGYLIDEWSENIGGCIYSHYSEREIIYNGPDSFVAHFNQKLIWAPLVGTDTRIDEAYYTIEAYR